MGLTHLPLLTLPSRRRLPWHGREGVNCEPPQLAAASFLHSDFHLQNKQTRGSLITARPPSSWLRCGFCKKQAFQRSLIAMLLSNKKDQKTKMVRWLGEALRVHSFGCSSTTCFEASAGDTDADTLPALNKGPCPPRAPRTAPGRGQWACSQKSSRNLEASGKQRPVHEEYTSLLAQWKPGSPGGSSGSWLPGSQPR